MKKEGAGNHESQRKDASPDREPREETKWNHRHLQVSARPFRQRVLGHLDIYWVGDVVGKTKRKRIKDP